MPQAEPRPSALRIVSVSVAIVVIFITVLSIPLAAGQEMGLTPGELSSWIMVIYGLPAVLGTLLAFRYQQPLLLNGSMVAIIFVASIGTRIDYAELVGAFIVAGIAVTVLGMFGLTRHLTQFVPAPIVWALLAGIVLPFIVNIFTPLGDDALMIGATLSVYLVSRWWLGSSPTVILPAMVVGILVAGLTGDLGSVSFDGGLPQPTVTFPTFSLQSVATVVPVVVVLMTVQANIPTAVVMRNHGYEPPQRVVDIASGLGTAAGSLFGPMVACLSLPLTPLVAGPDAGERSLRHRTIYLANGGIVAIAIFAGAAAAISQIIPLSLLLALAGLTMLGVLISALRNMVSGEVVIGPVFTFAIAISDLSLLGFGSIFWALAIGTGVSMLLEGEQLKALRQPAPAGVSGGDR